MKRNTFISILAFSTFITFLGFVFDQDSVQQTMSLCIFEFFMMTLLILGISITMFFIYKVFKRLLQKA